MGKQGTPFFYYSIQYNREDYHNNENKICFIQFGHWKLKIVHYIKNGNMNAIYR